MSARRLWALPLVPLYWGGLLAKDAVRAAGYPKERSLQWPVISVGSLSAGGAGKTPVVIALVELLSNLGWQVDVLTRGYGRSGRGEERVIAQLPSAAFRFGDEPVLIAQRTGVPVWVGPDRHRAGTRAEQASRPVFLAARDRTQDRAPDRSTHPSVHLLDDGFQHRGLARAFDIVLVTAADLDDRLLPAGNRREPLAALSRADAVVVRQDEAATVTPRLTRRLRPGVPIWITRRSIRFDPEIPSDDSTAAADFLAFCGIARPGGFFSMLRERGLRITKQTVFADHHRYTLRDVSRLAESCHLEGCSGMVTTEKDAVKLGPELRGHLERAGALHIARLDAVFVETTAVVQALEAVFG